MKMKRMLVMLLVVAMTISGYSESGLAAAVTEDAAEGTIAIEEEIAVGEETTAAEEGVKIEETAGVTEEAVYAENYTEAEAAEEVQNAAASDETESDFPQNTLVLVTTSYTMYGQAVSALNEGREAGDMISCLADDEYALHRLMLKTNGAEVDFQNLNAVCVIAGPENHYAIQFDTSEDTKKAMYVLSSNVNVKYVEPDSVVTIADIVSDENKEAAESDSIASNSWGVANIGADEYAEYVKNRTSSSITVAVIDTGVDYTHSFLSGRVLTNGYDFVDSDSDPYDLNGHGTHVSGTVVDCTPDLNVKIMPVRVLDEEGSGYSSDVASGIRYAAENGAKVINMSLRGGHASEKDDAVAYAISCGVSVVAAAGNDNGNTANYCPAHITDCIVVAAVDSDEVRSYFSNYGTAVDVTAPGEGIKSCVPGGGYEWWDGTSMAAPHVAGLVAMLRLVYPSYTPAQIESLLKTNTRDLGAAGRDDYYGYGIPDMRLLLGAEPTPTYTVSYNANGGSGAPESQFKTKDVELILADELPERFGYTFRGWASSASATTAEYLPGGVYTANADVTLYAVWESAAVINTALPQTYNVEINIAGNGKYFKFTPSVASTYEFESTGDWDTYVEVYNAATGETYYDDDGGNNYNFKISCELNANTTYYIYVGMWSSVVTGSFQMTVRNTAAAEYTIKYHANGGSGAPASQKKIQGVPLKLRTSVPVREGCTFLGWATSKTAATAKYQPGGRFTLDADTTLYAVWKKDIIKLSNGTGQSGTIISGDYNVYSFTASTAGVYAFFTTGSTNTYGRMFSDSDLKNQLQNNDNGGDGNNFRMDHYMKAGETVYIRVSGSGTSSGSYVVRASSKTTVKYHANGGSGAPASQEKLRGIALKLRTAVPTREGHTFLGWATSRTAVKAEYAPGASFAVNADTTLYAVWKKDIIKLSNGAGQSGTIIKGDYNIYSFTASTAGVYAFFTTGSTNTYGRMFTDSELKNQIQNNDNGGDGNNFRMDHYMKAGETVYIRVSGSGSSSGNYVVRVSSKTTVKYHANGGSGAPASQEKLRGVALKLRTAVPTRGGYTFLGWATSKTAVKAEYAPGASFAVNADTTLYAVWKKN